MFFRKKERILHKVHKKTTADMTEKIISVKYIELNDEEYQKKLSTH